MRRAAAALATILLTGAAIAACGTVLAPPAEAPVPTEAAAGATTGSAALAQIRTVRIGTSALPTGVPIPEGATLLGAPSVVAAEGGMKRWESTVDLAGASPRTALDLVRADLEGQGFAIQGGAQDVFAVRRCEDHWEIVVARLDTHGTGEDITQVLELGIGSRPL